MNWSKHIYTRLTSAMVIIFGGGIFTLILFGMLQQSQTLAAPLDTPDPEIRAATFATDTLALFDPTDGAGVDKTIYFNNTLPGVITVTFDVSGTAPLELTVGAAFAEPERIFSNTDSPWLQSFAYRVSGDSVSQSEVPYVVTNASNAFQQIHITYARDVTAPISEILSPEVGYVTGATLLIEGMATDNAGGSGIKQVQILTDTEWVTAVGGETWQYEWTLPEADGEEFTISARAEDNVGNWQSVVTTRVITVDNVLPGNPILVSVVPTNTWTNTQSITVTWTTVTDGSSVTYYYLWNQEGGTEIDENTTGVSTTTATAVTGENLPDGDNWLHLRTRDGAGNWAEGTVRIGSFKLVVQPISFDGFCPSKKNRQNNIVRLLDTLSPQELVLVTPIVTTTLPFTVSWGATDAPSGIAAYSLDYQRADQDWTPWLTETTKTADLFTGERGYTYTIRVRASDYAGNWSPWVASTTQIISYTLYLPVTIKPAPIPVGSLTIDSTRRQDITTFTPDVTLYLNATENPVSVRIWEAGDPEPSTWEEFSIEKPWTLSTSNALKTINIRYQGELGGISPVVSQSIFLLQNGDFADGLNGWNVTTSGLEADIVNNQLRLGKDTYACNGGVPVGYAQAQLALTIPQMPGYELRFSYKMYTQDQLGGQDNGRYDSFDVHINRAEPPDVLRAGNSTQSANCPNWFTVSPAGGYHPVPLDSYNGQITITFTNWSRADGWYNTYTDLERVWIVKK